MFSTSRYLSITKPNLFISLFNFTCFLYIGTYLTYTFSYTYIVGIITNNRVIPRCRIKKKNVS